MRVNKAAIILAVLCLAAVFPAGCGSSEEVPLETTLSLTSTAFPDGGAIPDKYTCQGGDVSPPLAWDEPTAGTRSLALIVEDLDTSGRFTHWVLFNIPADVRVLPEFVSRPALAGVLEGMNDFGKIGYGGPCPPPGKAHRYRFALYALGISLNQESGISKGELLDVMEGHALAQGELIGTYRR
jgi:Raf kinase inhibitor-like YbhB/YbcL family protein